MLAFSVREALRQAAAAFGPEGHSVELASPATPEAVFWAVQDARRALADDGAKRPLASGRGRSDDGASQPPASRRDRAASSATGVSAGEAASTEATSAEARSTSAAEDSPDATAAATR